MTEHEITINFPNLLQMLGGNIYTEPDMAVREMIQNANDTSMIRNTVDPTFKPEIHITFDKEAHTLTIADFGAGMTEEELHKNLATIGESFTNIQRGQLWDKDPQAASRLIGQFGIGLLSAFSISDYVEFLTLSYRSGATGCRWVCKGDIHYTVKPFDKAEPGTRVVLHVLDSKLELLSTKRLQQAIKKYADFLSVPILLNETRANVCTPPWEADDETTDLAEYIRSRWDIFPLGIISFNTVSENGKSGEPFPNVSGLLFVPMIPFELTRDFGEVDIYISRMFIKANDKELLPRWARFVKGVINTPDLTPTLSRSEIITNDCYHAVRQLLGITILDYLENLEKQDPEKLTLLVGAYNNTIKVRALKDDAFFERICDLVRVNTDVGQITISKYHQKVWQKDLLLCRAGLRHPTKAAVFV